MSKRTANVRIRLTPDERGAVIAAGAALGLGLSSFARMATVKAAGRKPAKPPRRKPDEHQRALAQWTGQLGKIGNLLNQATRALNNGDSPELAVLAAIRAELQALRETVLAFDAATEQ
jgi:hypothetical protein